MSRIDEALKRAAALSDGVNIKRELSVSKRHDNVESPAVSAWHLERLPSEGNGEHGPSGASPRVEPPAEKDTPPKAPPAGDPGMGTVAGSREIETPHARFAHGFSPHIQQKVVVSSGAREVVVEQYRKLAATLHEVQVERGAKIVMVASATSGEGKTLTAVNLALTLSESYRRRVLLIDADLRRPQMHEVFQVSTGCGLNEGLKATEEKQLSVVQVSPRLVLLPAGRPDPDPMGVLTSERMRRVIAEAAAAFDWVILDTPPVVLLPDTNLLAAMVDAAVLVIAAGRTPYKLISRAVEILNRERVIGVVLNRTEDAALQSGYVYDDQYRYLGAAAL